MSRRGVVTWIANRLSHLDLNHRPIAQYFEYLAHEGTAKATRLAICGSRWADRSPRHDRGTWQLAVKIRSRSITLPAISRLAAHGHSQLVQIRLEDGAVLFGTE